MHAYNAIRTLSILVCLATDPASWSVEEVVAWLHRHNMGVYEAKFTEFGIDGQCLVEGFDTETLTQLGVNLPIHQKKLLRITAALFAKCRHSYSCVYL